MGKTVTISVSTKYVKETVTLQELGITRIWTIKQ